MIPQTDTNPPSPPLHADVPSESNALNVPNETAVLEHPHPNHSRANSAPWFGPAKPVVNIITGTTVPTASPTQNSATDGASEDLAAVKVHGANVPTAPKSRKKLVFASDEELFGAEWLAKGSTNTEDNPTAAPSAEPVPGSPNPPVHPGGDDDLLAAIDRENDLKHSLKQRWSVREKEREEFEADLYELHKVMAGAGRGGKFTPFLRDELGWDDKRAYDKAMRGIARHKYRVGLITYSELQQAYGNKKKDPDPAPEPDSDENTTSRGDSAGQVQKPQLTQSFTVIVDEADLIPPPHFSDAELDKSMADLETRKTKFQTTVLHRALMTHGVRDWFDAAWQMQARRHGTKTYRDTVKAVFFFGTKPAAKDNAWDQAFDEILAEVGKHPELAHLPDRDFDDARHNAADHEYPTPWFAGEDQDDHYNPPVAAFADEDPTLDDFEDVTA